MFRSQEAAYSPAPTSEEDEKKQRNPKQSRKKQYLKPFLVLIFIFVTATFLATFFLGTEVKPFWLPDFSGSVESVQVKKSPYDSRAYKYFALSNGLQVLAISDPTADRCAASMDVSVGHFSDPEDFPGLAHFLEHMLFMGSQKYPDENYYSSYLSQHGGSSNAYTAQENTNYHFDITPEYFEEALDVFAQFFVSPLLREGSTEREVNAVQNEHIKNLQVDGWRAQQLRKHMANPKHPMHKFGTGNMETLCNNSKTGTPATHCHKTRKALMDFYKEHYNARRMRLVVSCKKDLRTLQRQIGGSFGDVPTNGARNPEQWDVPVKSPGIGARIVEYVPIRDSRVISIIWNLPPIFQFFKYKAGSYVSHLLGHEAKGSVAALLKKEGLIESLSAGSDSTNRYGAALEISVSLTEKGQEHIYEVLGYIFQYIRLVQKAGPLEWVWRESADLAAMHFRFKEKSDPAGYVVGLASNLQLYPPEFVIAAPYTYEIFDPQILKWIMDHLSPEKADIYMCSKTFSSTATQKEPIYGTQYNVFPVQNKTVWNWNHANIDSRLHIVKANQFVPKNFTIIGKKATGDTNPIKLVDRVGARLWFKQDRDFSGKNWVPKPKLSTMFQITSPYTDSSARASVMTTLFTMMYMDAMMETTYDAQAAGLGWSLSSSDDGLLLSVGGYNDKLFLLLKQVVEPMVACLRRNSQCLWANPERFENIKDELKRGLENSKKSPPYTKAMEKIQQLMKKRIWSVDRLLYELSLNTMDLDSVAEHVKHIFSRVYIEGFVHGNCEPQQARRFLEEIAIALGSFPLPEEERDLQQVVKLEGGMVYAEPHSNPSDLNHAIELYYQTPKRGIDIDVRTALLGAMASEPCFDQLRTKEQLGYLVACRSKPISATYPPMINGFGVLIQSSFKDPPQLDLSARRFIDGFVTNMTSMPKEKFQAHKTALISQIEEKEVTISQETGRLWGEIIKKRYEWSRRKHLVEALKAVSLQDMAKFSKELIDLNSHSLSSWIYGKARDVPDDQSIMLKGDVRQRIPSISDFKRSNPPYFPVEVPSSVTG